MVAGSSRFVQCLMDSQFLFAVSGCCNHVLMSANSKAMVKLHCSALF